MDRAVVEILCYHYTTYESSPIIKYHKPYANLKIIDSVSVLTHRI